MSQVARSQDEPWPVPLLRSQGADLEPKLQDALAAYDFVARNPSASAQAIAPIVRAALDPHVAIHEHATQLLGLLTADHEAARIAVAKMAEQSNWQYRLNALLSLGAATPKDFATALVRKLLPDGSARVREKAAERALELGLSGLAEALREAAANEADDAVATALELAHEMLRDGYTVKPADGGFRITVLTGSGAIGSWYSQADVAKRGLQAILTELRGSPAAADAPRL